jgi:hypothetical protein
LPSRAASSYREIAFCAARHQPVRLGALLIVACSQAVQFNEKVHSPGTG